MHKYLICIGLILFSSTLAAPSPKKAKFEIRFVGHHFSPQSLDVPAGQALEIVVVNSSRERIEFESFKLNREKVVGPGDSITVHLPPLHAGTYDFFDDFHDDVPEGSIIAR